MHTIHRRDLSPEERRIQDRNHARALLSGTALVPTKTCLACGSPALVKEGELQMARRPGFSGTAVALCAICLTGCKQVAVRTSPELAAHAWTYGTAPVVLTEGEPYAIKDLPQEITPRQRERLEAFLASA